MSIARKQWTTDPVGDSGWTRLVRLSLIVAWAMAGVLLLASIAPLVAADPPPSASGQIPAVAADDAPTATNTPTATSAPTATRTPSPTSTTACTNCLPDGFEPDNSQALAKPLPLSVVQTHTFHAPVDVDWFRLESLAVGRSVRIATSNLVDGSDTYMILYDENGAIIRANDDIDTARCLVDPQYCASAIEWAPERSGPYYLLVRTLTYPRQQYPSCPCPGYDIRMGSAAMYLPLIIAWPIPTTTPTPTPSLTPTATTTRTTPAPTAISLPGGSRPNGVAVNARTQRVYVTSRDDDRLYMIDGLTMSDLASVAVGDAPWGVAVNSNTNKVYVANFASNDLYVLDGQTLSLLKTMHLGPNPTFVRVNENVNQVFVITYGNEGLLVIDGASDSLIRIVGTGNKGSWGLAVNPTLNRVYVSGRNTGTITTLDGNNGYAVIKEQTIKTGGDVPCSPFSLEYLPAQQRLYAACAPSGSVDTVLVYYGHAGGLVPIARRSVGAGGADGGGGIVANPATGNVFITNSLVNSTSVMDGASTAIIAEVPVGADPFGIGLDATTGYVFVANRGSASVSVFRDPSAP